MAIKSVNHPERDLGLADRESGNGAGEKLATPRPNFPESSGLQAALQRAKLQATITQAKSRLANKYKCECFERGWMAAIAEIESGAA